MTLLERLAQATGPDRNLDYEIARAIGLEAERGEYTPNHWPDEWACRLVPPAWASLPQYTGSVDAAATLVDPERWWLVNTGARQQSARAMVDVGRAWESYEGHGANPAIALTIAALKARGIE